MEIEGIDIWRDVREQLVERNPIAVLRTLPTSVDDLSDEFDAFLEVQDPLQVLEILGEPLLQGSEPRDAALEALQRLAAGDRRFSREKKKQVGRLVLRFFDAWASREDNPGAVIAGRIISARSREIARWEFDSGYPGSGQSIGVYRRQRGVVTISEYAVYGFYSNLREVLKDWIESGARDHQIFGPMINAGLLERLRRELEIDDPADTVSPASRSWQPMTAAELAASRADDASAAEAHERSGDAHASASDYAAALKAWRLAAARGSATAHWKLAVLFCRGAGTRRDAMEAARRCRSAAEAGDPRARLRLARASERLLKYADSDLWQNLAAESGLSSAALKAARRLRIPGTKAQTLAVAIQRLFDRAAAGRFSALVDLAALFATSGRIDEAQQWWAKISADPGRLRVDDALVLELSREDSPH